MSGIRPEELLARWFSGTAFLNRSSMNVDTVDGFKVWLGNSLRYEGGRASELAQLVDREDTVADKFRLGVGEIREDETWAIAQENSIAQVNSLEMLRLAGSRGDRNLLGTNKGVDGGRLSDVGITNQADLQFPFRAYFSQNLSKRSLGR